MHLRPLFWLLGQRNDVSPHNTPGSVDVVIGNIDIGYSQSR